MPDYSTVSAERDVFGELGWIPNFEVTKSKNNKDRHIVYREMFDAPKEYTTEFHTASMTNTEFFRQNAPQNSVAKLVTPDLHGSKSVSGMNRSGTFDHRRSFNPIERNVYSATRRPNNNKIRSEFILRPDTSNKHRVSNIVHSTVSMHNSIPFLRDVRNVSNQKFIELANTEEKDHTFNLLSVEMRRTLRVQSKSK